MRTSSYITDMLVSARRRACLQSISMEKEALTQKMWFIPLKHQLATRCRKASYFALMFRTAMPRVRFIYLQPTHLLILDSITEEIAEKLRATFPNTSISKNDLPRIQEPRQGPHISNGPSNAESSILQATSVASSETVLFIGPESLALTNLLMTKSSAQVYRYDPRDRRCNLESARTNKLLMRRYAVMQRARDADVFGILVGTLGVASYLHLITEVRKMLAREGKKTYTISVGKLNPAKLANFAEIECFVLIACPENSIVESKEFLRPIVTPFELSIALGVAPSWDGRYLLDFGEVLVDCRTQERDASAKDDKEEEEEEVQPEFSLITGKYRQVKRYGQRAIPEEGLSTGDEGALIARNNEGTVAQVIESASGDFMRNRTWQGLEQRLGEDEPGLLEQGRSGIARGYHEVER
ncbi:Diphthamide biosynthesis protein 2 [Serendipita sp. 407]|nr:Diphthamide biosynthesis protein 2 [Serendipita sp. 407]